MINRIAYKSSHSEFITAWRQLLILMIIVIASHCLAHRLLAVVCKCVCSNELDTVQKISKSKWNLISIFNIYLFIQPTGSRLARSLASRLVSVLLQIKTASSHHNCLFNQRMTSHKALTVYALRCWRFSFIFCFDFTATVRFQLEQAKSATRKWDRRGEVERRAIRSREDTEIKYIKVNRIHNRWWFAHGKPVVPPHTAHHQLVFVKLIFSLTSLNLTILFEFIEFGSQHCLPNYFWIESNRSSRKCWLLTVIQSTWKCEIRSIEFKYFDKQFYSMSNEHSSPSNSEYYMSGLTIYCNLCH